MKVFITNIDHALADAQYRQGAHNRLTCRPTAITVGETYRKIGGGNWADLDCDGHGGAARVVTRMTGDDVDYGYGLALVKLFKGAPALRDALAAIVDAESIYEAQTLARDALKALE